MRTMKEPPAPIRKDARLLLVILAILLFSTLDAIFTVLLIETGHVTEGNPLMAVLIERDVRLFARTKTFVTAGGLLLLVVLLERYMVARPRMAQLLDYLLLAYLALIGYHFSLTLLVLLD
jgi:hypothetical protein